MSAGVRRVNSVILPRLTQVRIICSPITRRLACERGRNPQSGTPDTPFRVYVMDDRAPGPLTNPNSNVAAARKFLAGHLRQMSKGSIGSMEMLGFAVRA